MNAYSTTADYITETIIPALGDAAESFDIDAIAYDMLTWEDGQLVEREGIDFWDVAAAHDSDI